jgi:hypothetical protein
MPRTRLMAAAVLTVAVLTGACAGTSTGGTTTGPDLAIERQQGYAVVVDETGGRILIGFSADRNATSGDSYDVTQAVWREGDGPWNEPPVPRLGRGQRVELGIAKVQNADQPGLLKDRVVWISCLAPPTEG